MRSMRTGAMALAAIVVPVALAVTALVISRSSTGSQLPPVPGIVFQDQGQQAGSSPSARPATSSPRPSASSGGVQATPTVGDDHGGRCSEPEHANDPSCGGGGSDDSGSSGPGGGSGSSGSGSSGSGSGSGGSGDD